MDKRLARTQKKVRKIDITEAVVADKAMKENIAERVMQRSVARV